MALFVLCAGGCSSTPSPAAGTIELTFGQEKAEWARIASVTVRRGDGTTSAIAFEGAIDAASVDVGEAVEGTSTLFSAEARDAAGATIARGQTSLLPANELVGETVPVLLGPLGGSVRPTTGLVGSWRGGGAGVSVLLQGRFALFTSVEAATTGGAAEVYDVGFWQSLTGGPSLPRAPKVLLAATTRDVFVLDETGASLADVFSVSTATTLSVSAADASALTDGLVLEGASAVPGRWIAGPCAWRVGATPATPSSVVLFLDATDAPHVGRLTSPRRGAACAVLPDGSLAIAGGGAETLAIVSPTGASTEVPFVDDRVGGAAITTAEGALVLFGGATVASSAAPAARLALPCASTCTSTELTIVGDPLPAAAAARSYSYSTGASVGGRAFVVADEGAGQRAFFATVTAAATTFVEIPLRIPRHGAHALALDGERLLLAGGDRADGAGGAILDVEVLTAP